MLNALQRDLAAAEAELLLMLGETVTFRVAGTSLIDIPAMATTDAGQIGERATDVAIILLVRAAVLPRPVPMLPRTRQASVTWNSGTQRTYQVLTWEPVNGLEGVYRLEGQRPQEQSYG